MAHFQIGSKSLNEFLFEGWAIKKFQAWKSEPSRNFATWSRFWANLKVSHLKISCICVHVTTSPSMTFWAISRYPSLLILWLNSEKFLDFHFKPEFSFLSDISILKLKIFEKYLNSKMKNSVFLKNLYLDFKFISIWYWQIWDVGYWMNLLSTFLLYWWLF